MLKHRHDSMPEGDPKMHKWSLTFAVSLHCSRAFWKANPNSSGTKVARSNKVLKREALLTVPALPPVLAPR